MPTVSAGRLATMFVEVADTLAAEFDLIEFIRMPADRVAGLVTGSEVGILLADPRGTLRFTAASDETSEFLDLFRPEKQAGPCADAFLTAAAVADPDLRNAGAHRPRFAPWRPPPGSPPCTPSRCGCATR